jgi:hypothetical protein
MESATTAVALPSGTGAESTTEGGDHGSSASDNSQSQVAAGTSAILKNGEGRQGEALGDELMGLSF